jgi:hypothetical protein
MLNAPDFSLGVAIIFSFITDDYPGSSRYSFLKFYLIFYMAGTLSADAASKPGPGEAIECDFCGDLTVFLISQSFHSCELPKIDGIRITPIAHRGVDLTPTRQRVGR